MTGIGLALLAGLLSTLSPCVLPLVPIVIATALGEHRFGPAALAGGLALSFVVIGMFVATVGFAAGLDQELFRSIAAMLLILVGGVLLMPRLQHSLATAAGPIGNWAQAQAGGFSTRARAENLTVVALTMLAFGIGAALPLLALGMMSREALARWRGRLLSVGSGGKVLMGVMLVATGALILTGLDKRIETILVEASPAWLTQLTTRF
jgi:cytochrome c-type biogenesis protein